MARPFGGSDVLGDPLVRTRKRRLAVSASLSVVVGVWVAVTTRRLTPFNCPHSIAPDAFRITEARFDHLHVHVDGCATIVPLLPTYLGLGVLLLGAVWMRRSGTTGTRD